MNKLYYLLAFLAVLTIFIAIFNPQLHKPLVISEGRYGVRTSDIVAPENKLNTVVTNQDFLKGKEPVVINNETTSVPAKTITTSSQNTVSAAKTNIVNKNTTKNTSAKVNQTPVKSVTKTVNTKPVTQAVQKPVVKTEPKKEVKTETPKQEVKSQVQTPVVKPQEKITQEEISWNVWRSKLANQIISEIRVPAVPEGTIFEFSFNVNNQGIISNVKTKSSSPQYTAYAIQYIAPVIRSFQGRSILKFPAGTERTSILFESKWRVVNGNVQYSTPANYHDIEVIRK